MPTGSVDKVYTAADQLNIVDYSDEGYVYLTITADDQSDLTALHFFVDSTDTDILIPEGVYPINKSYRPGTVLGNMGPNEDNQLSTPFYATMNPQGYLVDVYMWVKGSVTVEKRNDKLYLEINALNSYDVPVHIVYDASLTNVQNVIVEKNDCQKLLINGQIFIICGDAIFNAVGVRIR